MIITRSVRSKATNISLIAMDIDGVLTDGSIVVLESGEEVKTWNVKDRFAFHLARRSGGRLKLAWITGRRSNQVAKHAKEIGVDILYQGCMKKKEAMQEIIKDLGITARQVAYVGDDLVDIPVLRFVGFSVCPKDAPSEVKDSVHHITSCGGGKGVLREVIEIILKSQGTWKTATKDYL